MAMHIYCRVSSEAQSFERQMVGVKTYFEQRGLDITKVESIVEEHVSGGKSYEDRKLKNLLLHCNKGDIIYAASTDRLGRSFLDMMKLMSEAKKSGITIIACKQNLSLADDSMTTRLMLTILTMMDEDERVRTSERNKEKAAWQKEQIEKKGGFVIKKGPNAGQICTKLGRPKGGNLDVARAASNKVKQDNAAEWRANSKGYQLVKMMLAKGKSNEEIMEAFNQLHEIDPENYSTPSGKELKRCTLLAWRRELKMELMFGNLVIPDENPIESNLAI